MSDLYSALVKAQAVVRSAAKDSKNQHGRYNYASREEIAAIGKGALREAGLAFMLEGPSQILNRRAVSVTDKGGTYDIESVDILLTGVLIHESGERSWPVLWTVEFRKGMTPEQRIGSAISYAHKNTLLSLLNIPRGVEEDVDSTDHREYTPGVQRPSAPPDPDADERATILKALALPEHREKVKPVAQKFGIEDPDALKAAGIQTLRDLRDEVVFGGQEQPPV